MFFTVKDDFEGRRVSGQDIGKNEIRQKLKAFLS